MSGCAASIAFILVLVGHSRKKKATKEEQATQAEPHAEAREKDKLRQAETPPARTIKELVST